MDENVSSSKISMNTVAREEEGEKGKREEESEERKEKRRRSRNGQVLLKFDLK